MQPQVLESITEMAVCVALCSTPEPKNALISPVFANTDLPRLHR